MQRRAAILPLPSDHRALKVTRTVVQVIGAAQRPHHCHHRQPQTPVRPAVLTMIIRWCMGVNGELIMIRGGAKITIHDQTEEMVIRLDVGDNEQNVGCSIGGRKHRAAMGQERLPEVSCRRNRSEWLLAEFA